MSQRRHLSKKTFPGSAWTAFAPSWAPAPNVMPNLRYPGHLGGLMDPEQDLNSADLEDPEQDLNSADLEDPEQDLNSADLEDPEQSILFPPPFFAPVPCALPSPWPSGCCGPSGSSLGAASCEIGAGASFAYAGFIIARLIPGIEPDGYDDLHQLAVDKGLKGLQKVLELKDEDGGATEVLPSWPRLRYPAPASVGNVSDVNLAYVCSPYDRLRNLERKAATTSFPPLHSLTSYWRIDLRQHPERLDKVLERLNALADIDHAYRELAATDPGGESYTTGRFSGEQEYLDDAPVGIGARWAWDRLPAIADKKVTCCDLEQRWAGHRNLPSLNLEQDLVFGDNRAVDDKKPDHGTAVCGQLIAEPVSSSDLEGIAARVARLKLASHYDRKLGFNGHVAEAIAHVIGAGNSGRTDVIEEGLQSAPDGVLKAGDLLIIEVQRSYLPAEIDDADFDAIRLASALGITVFEAAGNGGFDLGRYVDPRGRRIFARGAAGFRDSGAILVGAAHAGLPHNRTASSNYGDRIDVYGWGNDVFTCGYGDFFEGVGEEEHLTDTFSGTSAATPIAAGAGALLQAFYKHNVDSSSYLTPIRLREILSDPEKGTLQGPQVPGHIGVMPDLCKILRGLNLVPSPYMRKSPGDDGTRPVCSDHFSSPDIFVRQGSAFPVSHLSGGAKESAPTPGLAWVPGGPVHVFARVKDRGLSEAGRVGVRLFYSAPATFITPEMWHLIGETELSVPQGEVLAPSLPVPWTPPNAEASHYSFLAVLAAGTEESCEVPPLPCGFPYFDWEVYRSFLRADHVACRNVHKLPVEVGQTPTASFSLTGTPDTTRRFDFEVIQKLPKGVKAMLALPPLIALKLRRRLAGNPGAGTSSTSSAIVTLPAVPRLLFKNARLIRGSRYPATLTFHGDLMKLQAGHSFIVRQLFRGEEVGRITWYLDRSAE